jgi:hypothetical protein
LVAPGGVTYSDVANLFGWCVGVLPLF